MCDRPPASMNRDMRPPARDEEPHAPAGIPYRAHTSARVGRFVVLGVAPQLLDAPAQAHTQARVECIPKSTASLPARARVECAASVTASLLVAPACTCAVVSPRKKHIWAQGRAPTQPSSQLRTANRTHTRSQPIARARRYVLCGVW